MVDNSAVREPERGPRLFMGGESKELSPGSPSPNLFLQKSLRIRLTLESLAPSPGCVNQGH